MVDIYQNPERLKNSLVLKRQNVILATGKEMFNLTKKLFSKSIFNIGKDKKMKVPDDYLELYEDWKIRNPGNTPGWNEREQLLNDILINPEAYYDDLNALYMKIGRELFLKVRDKVKYSFNQKSIDEAYYGGTYNDYAYAFQETERYREYGEYGTDIITRLWRDEFKKKIRKKMVSMPLSPISKSIKTAELIIPLEPLRPQGDEEEEKEEEEEVEGSGILPEDYIRWSKNYTKYRSRLKKKPKITFQQAFQDKIDRDITKFYSSTELLYIHLSNILKQIMFEKSSSFAKILKDT